MQDRSSGISNAVSLLGAFLAASLVLGLLAAGLFMPAAGLVGATTKEVIGTIDALPAEIAASPLATQSKVLDSHGSVIAILSEENREVVPLEAIAPIMQRAQVAIEDDRFYEHSGVDARAMMRAFTSTLMKNRQGASTITQQYVKQTLVYTALANDDKEAAEAASEATGIKGYVRKVEEAKLAIALEKKKSKNDILEGYMNIAYYGAQAYGVQAASKRYFGIPASKLDLPQAALLAGLVQRPGVTDPIRNPKAALKRRNIVLQRMLELTYISKRQYAQAIAAPVKVTGTPPKRSCLASTDPYVCDYVVNWLLDQPSLGKDREDRRKTIFRRGLTIRSTIDMPLVASIRKALRARGDYNSLQRGMATAVVEPGTGKVMAIAQSTDYRKTQVNWSVDKMYGESNGFQIGSTAKMFGIVTALEQGMTASSSITAPPDGTWFSASRLMAGEKCGFAGSWNPHNAESNEHGPMTLGHATAASVNTAFVALAARVSICKERETMRKMGLKKGDGEPYGAYMSSVVLGADEASPVTLAGSYAVLPAGGKFCEPTPVASVVGYDNKKYALKTSGCTDVIKGSVAYDATRMLQGVLTNGTGRGIGGLSGGRAAAGKTGTSDESKQTWFVGYTPQRTVAVWYGTPRLPRRMPGVYGATIAGPMWRTVMNLSTAGLPVRSFKRMENSLDGKTGGVNLVEVPNVFGRARYKAVQILEEAGFKVSVSDRRVDSDRAAGRVAWTRPNSGDQAPEGSTVTVSLSNGSRYQSQQPQRTKRPKPTSSRSASPSARPSPSTKAPSAKAAPSSASPGGRGDRTTPSASQ